LFRTVGGFLFSLIVLTYLQEYKAMLPSILRRFKIRAEKRTVNDRRSGRDRRKLYDVHYLSEEGFLKGLRVERRSEPERREDWIRVSKWGSVPTED
jgi:hypothetical protein